MVDVPNLEYDTLLNPPTWIVLEKRPYEAEAVPWISRLLFEVMAWLNVVVPVTERLPLNVALLDTSKSPNVVPPETERVSVSTFWGLDVILPIPLVLEEGREMTVGVFWRREYISSILESMEARVSEGMA